MTKTEIKNNIETTKKGFGLYRHSFFISNYNGFSYEFTRDIYGETECIKSNYENGEQEFYNDFNQFKNDLVNYINDTLN